VGTLNSTLSRRRKVSKRVYIDEDECIACGTCEDICPEVFKVNEETEKAEVVDTKSGGGYHKHWAKRVGR